MKKGAIKLKQKFNTILPPFTRLPLLCLVLFNMLVYYGTKLITINAKHHDLSIGLDNIIPFVPFFILFYILAYAQWVFSYIHHSKQNESLCYQLVSANIIAKAIAGVFFIVLPAEIQLPEINGNGLWDTLTQFIYHADTPRTLFPSLHCLESWMCFRTAMYVTNKPKWYVPAQGILTILIFASTVFVKQHFFVDIFAGIAVSELGLQIAKRFNFSSLFLII